MTRAYLYVTVGTRSVDRYPVSIGLQRQDFEHSIDAAQLGRLAARFHEASVDSWRSLGEHLYQLVFPPEADVALREITGQPRPHDYFLVLRLDVQAPELLDLPWELLTPAPAQPSDPLPFHLVRYHGVPHDFGLISLPVRVLIASSSSAGTPGFDLENRLLEIFHDPAWVERAFRATRLGWDRLDALAGECSGQRFDILHLVGRAGEFVGESGLPELVAGVRPRLVILQTEGASPGDPLTAACAAADLVRSGTPGVLASDLPANYAEPLFNVLYDALVHDIPLDAAVESSRRQLCQSFPGDMIFARPALFLAQRGEEALRISPLAANVQRRAETAIGRVERAMRNLENLTRAAAISRPSEPLLADAQTRSEALRRTESSLRGGRERAAIPLWDRESRGIIPLEEATRIVDSAEADAEAELDRLADLQEMAERREPRVVNTWFAAGETALRRDQSLRAAARCEFVLRIGSALRESVVLNPRPIPETALEPFYDASGLKLLVVLSSNDFLLERHSADLLLPRAGPTETLRFALRAPERAGRARLRASIYFRGNLLQSILARAEITPEAAAGLENGNVAEVDYCFSGAFQDLDTLTDRTVNVLTNDSADGTHTFAVHGKGLKEHFDLTEGEMSAAIGTARARYLETCSELKDGKPVKYRFSEDNRGDAKRFADDLKRLAFAGYNLYFNLLCHKDRDFEDELRDVLTGPASIQISSSKSAKYVVPWALFYDRRLVYDQDANVVCPEFLAALKAGGPPGHLERQACLTGHCPNEGDTNIVCPSGFWGFKHVIEQPPSTVVDGDAPPRGEPARDVVREIVARGRPEFVMAVNQELGGWNKHATAIQTIVPMRFQCREKKADIGTVLLDPQLHLVYFYCHGKKSGTLPWLGVGAKGHEERLLPTDLHGWGIGWSTNPLVFINGCHTVDMTPDDLVNFVNAFTWCKAAGVIGTEIPVPESLAQEFASGFLKRFLGEGLRVGGILRRERLLLLEKWNPLGLVYTPYCSADLTVRVREAPNLDVLMIEARRSPDYTAVETEAPVLDGVWKSAGLKYRIVSNDARYQPGPGASKADFVQALRTEWGRVVHLAVHGDGASLGLRWSQEADPSARSCVEKLRPLEITRLDLTGSVVVSGACLSGMNTLADAFFTAGARAYVAPVAEVEWAKLVPFFKAFYEALAGGSNLRDAVAAGRTASPEAGRHYQIKGDELAVVDRVP